ncbi:tandem-95 repeat protein [Pseudomonadota bacterium]
MSIKTKMSAFITLVSALLFAAPSLAATQAQIDNARANGIAWLIQNQNGDGSWGDIDASTRMAATTESMEALRRSGAEYGHLYTRALSWVANSKTESVDSLARKIEHLEKVGLSSEELGLMQELMAHRDVANNCWGPLEHYDCSFPDTSIAMDAILNARIASGYSYADDFSTLDLIMSSHAPYPAVNGWSFVAAGDGSDINQKIMPTAYTMRTLLLYLYYYQYVYQIPASAIYNEIRSHLSTGAAWLLNRSVAADGSIRDDASIATGSVQSTALAYIAVVSLPSFGLILPPTDAAKLVSAQDFIISQQQADGSWDGDAFVTALAMRSFPSATMTDTDNDGVPDTVETILGTNPNVSDGRGYLDSNGLDPDNLQDTGLSAPAVMRETVVNQAFSHTPTISGGTPGYSWSLLTGSLPSGISLVSSATGQLSGTPSYVGTQTFTLQAQDAVGNNIIVPVHIHVLATDEETDSDGDGYSSAIELSLGMDPLDANSVPTVPLAVDDSGYSLDQGGALDTAVASLPSVLANDIDSDTPNASLTAVLDTAPSNGSVVLNSEGSFVYTHNGSQPLSDSFTYYVNDGASNSPVPAAVSIVISNVVPVADDADIETPVDVAFLGTLVANDVTGDTLTYSIVDNGTSGNAVITNTLTGAFTYTPVEGFSGDDSFTFRVTDSFSAVSNAATVSITVALANVAPVAFSDTMSTTEGSAVTADIIANDQDVNLDVLSIAAVDAVSKNGGAIVDNGDGTVTYTPPTDFWGSDAFFYQVTDGMETVTGGVTVTIAPINSTEIRVNAGGNEVVDSLGRTWAADYGFNNTGIAAGIGNAISGKESANDTYIYQTERTTDWDGSTISYSYDVPNGDYHVILHFADTYYWLNDQRVFDVSIEGQLLLNYLDIISEVSYNAPLIEHLDVLVSDGTINLDFMPLSETPVINAIEIIAKGISKSAIPGTIQAEDYNAGENGTAYNDIWGGNDGAIYRRDDVDVGVTSDIGGGYKIGWMQDSEWLNYDVFVAETGFYDIDIRSSNPSVDWYWGRMKLELDGTDLTSLLIAPLTAGSDMFDESSVRKVPMTAGPHTLKLIINQGGIDVNWLKFTKHTSYDIPGRIEAEDYGHGGAAVSYSDSSIGNYAGWYRKDDVDVDITSDVGGGYKVAWIAGNEWLKYDATITSSGTYDVEFRVSKGDVGDAIFHLERDGIDITGPITVSGSGTYDWDMFNTLTLNNVNLTEGTASFRIVIDQASLDINWMQFILISPN